MVLHTSVVTYFWWVKLWLCFCIVVYLHLWAALFGVITCAFLLFCLLSVLRWAVTNRQRLLDLNSSLEFKLHRLYFISLLNGGVDNQLEALHYARHFQPFATQHQRGESLLCSPGGALSCFAWFYRFLYLLCESENSTEEIVCYDCTDTQRTEQYKI